MRTRSLCVVLAAFAIFPASATAASHTVLAGETLWGIATANHLSASAVAQANGLSSEARVVAGTTLNIPIAGQTAAPAAASGTASGGVYTVQPGDSLSQIAARQGVSLSALAATNGLRLNSWVLAGTTLRMPGAGSAAVSTAAPEAMGAYKVRIGDTLSGLAAKVGVSAAQMAYMNGLKLSAPLIAGTVIKLPTGASIQSSAPAPARTIVPQVAPLATAGRLTAAEVTQAAARGGAPASLAAAIAWQESGFNNAKVSGANARGIMQLLPGTWDWVQANLSGDRLDPASPADNVRAGSMYLAHLLRETNGDPGMAAAAYYQGLSSVRQVGMLPETKQYVANVLALRSRFGG
jgi:LysM repeat protein